MAVAFRSQNTINHGSRTNTTITAPSGLASGDVLLLWFVMSNAGTPPTPTFSDGLTALGGTFVSTVTSGADTNRGWLAWKVAGGSEPSSYTVTHTTSTTDGWLAAYTGADNTAPLTPTPSFQTGTGTTSTASSITTDNNDSGVVFCEHSWDNLGNTLTGPSGTTPTFTKEYQGIIQYVADGTLATAGATGSKSISPNNNTAGTPWAAGLVALKAAAGTNATVLLLPSQADVTIHP